LVEERTKNHYSLEEWQNTWMHRINNRALFISAESKENLDLFRERVYAATRKIHITRFPYNNFLYPENLKEL
jgi:GTP-binding protein HflX